MRLSFPTKYFLWDSNHSFLTFVLVERIRARENLNFKSVRLRPLRRQNAGWGIQKRNSSFLALSLSLSLSLSFKFSAPSFAFQSLFWNLDDKRNRMEEKKKKPRNPITATTTRKHLRNVGGQLHCCAVSNAGPSHYQCVKIFDILVFHWIFLFLLFKKKHIGSNLIVGVLVSYYLGLLLLVEFWRL